VNLAGQGEFLVTTRNERAKTQAKIERVLRDIRRLEARGLGWVGAPAGIAGTMLAADDRQAMPIVIGSVARSKGDDRSPCTFRRLAGAPLPLMQHSDRPHPELAPKAHVEGRTLLMRL